MSPFQQRQLIARSQAKADAVMVVVMSVAAIALYTVDPLASVAWITSSALMTWWHRK